MEKNMDSRFLEIKVMYCKDLQAFNFFQKLMVYALVSIISDNPKKKLDQKQQRTPTDKEGDGNPEWNHEMKFEISEALVRDCEGIFIHFDLRHEGQYFGDKTIGIVQVPLKDLLEEPYGAVRFVNYQVKSPEGHPNGILNFSYKGNNRKCSDLVTNSSVHGISGFSNVQHHHHHHHHDLPETCYPSSEVPYPPPQEACYPPLATHYPTTPPQPYPPPPPPPPQLLSSILTPTLPWPPVAEVYHHHHLPAHLHSWEPFSSPCGDACGGSYGHSINTDDNWR